MRYTDEAAAIGPPYKVISDTGRNDTVGDVRVLRVFGQASRATGSEPAACAHAVLAVACGQDYVVGHGHRPAPRRQRPGSPAETAEEAKRRFAWKAARIAEADASLAAGLFIDAAEVDAWIDSIGTDHGVAATLSPPLSGRLRAAPVGLCAGSH